MNIHVYTDGSFAKLKEDRFGGGVLIIDKDKNVELMREALHFFVMPDELIKSKHVAAEACSALWGLTKVLSMVTPEETDVTLLVDNNGLVKWFTSEWQHKTETSAMWYRASKYLQKRFRSLEVKWVKGHTTYNEANKAVDHLASGFVKIPLKIGIIPDDNAIDFVPDTAVKNGEVDFNDEGVLRANLV